MVKGAINSHAALTGKNLEFVVTGSYGNNTNIKIDSDIDICVMLKDTFYSEYREGAKDADYGFIDGTNAFSDYKRWILEALNTKFGVTDVTAGNKAIKIKSNTYRVQADVVPAFHGIYNDYSDPKMRNFIINCNFVKNTENNDISR